MPEYIYSPRGRNSPAHRPGFGDCIPGEHYTTDDPGVAGDPDFKLVKTQAKDRAAPRAAPDQPVKA